MTHEALCLMEVNLKCLRFEKGRLGFQSDISIALFISILDINDQGLVCIM